MNYIIIGIARFIIQRFGALALLHQLPFRRQMLMQSSYVINVGIGRAVQLGFNQLENAQIFQNSVVVFHRPAHIGVDRV